MVHHSYLAESAKNDITHGLQQVLADSFVLYFKTHSFHWNVEGRHFKALHDMFEEQYTDLWNFTDECAERIRALGGYGPNSFKEMLQNASLQEAGQTPDALGMVQKLAEDNRGIVHVIYPVLRTAEEAGDEATVDMLIGRIHTHEKAAWMLESFAKEG